MRPLLGCASAAPSAAVSRWADGTMQARSVACAPARVFSDVWVCAHGARSCAWRVLHGARARECVRTCARALPCLLFVVVLGGCLCGGACFWCVRTQAGGGTLASWPAPAASRILAAVNAQPAVGQHHLFGAFLMWSGGRYWRSWVMCYACALPGTSRESSQAIRATGNGHQLLDRLVPRLLHACLHPGLAMKSLRLRLPLSYARDTPCVRHALAHRHDVCCGLAAH